MEFKTFYFLGALFTFIWAVLYCIFSDNKKLGNDAFALTIAVVVVTLIWPMALLSEVITQGRNWRKRRESKNKLS